MPLTLARFLESFSSLVSLRSVNWYVNAFHSVDGTLYSLGTDSKVLSTIFECICAPLVIEIAEEHSYRVESAPQTVYPDFTLTPNQGGPRIAIDIKTTYRETPSSVIKFTLGSYTSFLRDGTKNILYPLSEYSAHWVIGFVYQRCSGARAKRYHMTKTPTDLECPYSDVEWFIQHKHKIAGRSPGSGNTANIGSFPTRDISELRQGSGPFSISGEQAFRDYWRSFGR